MPNLRWMNKHQIHSPHSPSVRLAIWLTGLCPPAHIVVRPLQYHIPKRLVELNHLDSRVAWLCKDGRFRHKTPDGEVLSTVTEA